MKDLKDYLRRTIFVHCGMILPQIFLAAIGVQSIAKGLIIIACIESIVLIGYLILFGIKRKDGTLIRNEKIGIVVDELTNVRH